jgi:hypothetical protein
MKKLLRNWRLIFAISVFIIAGYCSSIISLNASEAAARASIPRSPSVHPGPVTAKVTLPWIVKVDRYWREGNFCGTNCGTSKTYLCLFGFVFWVAPSLETRRVSEGRAGETLQLRRILRKIPPFCHSPFPARRVSSGGICFVRKNFFWPLDHYIYIWYIYTASPMLVRLGDAERCGHAGDIWQFERVTRGTRKAPTPAAVIVSRADLNCGGLIRAESKSGSIPEAKRKRSGSASEREIAVFLEENDVLVAGELPMEKNSQRASGPAEPFAKDRRGGLRKIGRNPRSATSRVHKANLDDLGGRVPIHVAREYCRGTELYPIAQKCS